MDRQDAKTAKTPRIEPEPALDALARTVIDSAFEVHGVLGPGYGEMVYENALCVELRLRAIAYERQSATLVEYKGHCVGEGRLDLIVGGRLLVELKAVPALAPVHTAQVLAYLKATGQTLGLLINFNTALLKHGIKRVVLSPSLGALAPWRSHSSKADFPQ
jgi:GxxExxY protein